MAETNESLLPEGWRILTAYEVDGEGLLSTVGSTDARSFCCTVYPRGKSPVAARGATAREAIENARAKANAETSD